MYLKLTNRFPKVWHKHDWIPWCVCVCPFKNLMFHFCELISAIGFLFSAVQRSAKKEFSQQCHWFRLRAFQKKSYHKNNHRVGSIQKLVKRYTRKYQIHMQIISRKKSSDLIWLDSIRFDCESQISLKYIWMIVVHRYQ